MFAFLTQNALLAVVCFILKVSITPITWPSILVKCFVTEPWMGPDALMTLILFSAFRQLYKAQARVVLALVPSI